MSEPYRAIPAEEVFAKFSPELRARIKERAAEIIAEELALRDIRKARQVTQEEVAQRLGGKQVTISRLEKRAGVKVSTLRDYVKALGGELQLMVTFPEGTSVTTKELEPRRRRAKRSA